MKIPMATTIRFQKLRYRGVPGATKMMRRTFLPVLLLLSALPAASAPKISGLWDAVVVVNKADVPFRYEIEQEGGQVQGFFFEGDRKVGSTSGSFENGTLRLEYDFLNTTLEARLNGDQLRGTYRNNRADARPQEFRARKFAPLPVPTAAAPRVEGNWAMYRTA